MRIGRLGEFGFSASTDGGVSVGLPEVPAPPEVPMPQVGVTMTLEGEAIAQGANGPPPNPMLAVALQSSPYRTGLERYAKYLAPAGGGGRYAGASFAGSADEYRPGASGGGAPTYERGARYAVEGEVSTGAIVAGGAVLLALGALAAWRLGAFR